MSTIVKTRIVKIGNSQGIRIPKVLLEQSNLFDEVELELESDRIVVRPVRTARQGWDNAFQTMYQQGDDQLLDGEALALSTWDEDEWTW